MTSPDAMLDREAAVERVARAAKAGERVCVFGDYDADGVTAAALTTDVLRALGAEVVPLLADRFAGGYGVSRPALARILETRATLVVTCDCGSSDHERLAALEAAGVDVVVIDHHRVPDAPLPGRGVPQPAPAGVWLRLQGARVGGARAVALRGGADAARRGARHAAVARHGGHRDDRRRCAARRRQPAARADGARDAGAGGPAGGRGARSRPSRGAGRRRRRGRTSPSGSRRASTRPGGWTSPTSRSRSCSRRATTRRGAWPTRSRCTRRGARRSSGGCWPRRSSSWPTRRWRRCRGSWWRSRGGTRGVVGIVAGRLVSRFGKPAVVVALDGATGRGSARTPAGFSVYAALARARDTLVGFGGHDAAAGVEVASDRVEAFREAFASACAELGVPAKKGVPDADASLEAGDAPARVMRDLARFGAVRAGQPGAAGGHRRRAGDGRRARSGGGHLRAVLSTWAGRRSRASGPTSGRSRRRWASGRGSPGCSGPTRGRGEGRGGGGGKVSS